MDLNSAGSSPKRPRSKPKAETAAKAAAAPKPATSRPGKAKSADSTPVIEVTSITAIATPEAGELTSMIAMAAYYIAEQRNFAPGHELEDWLEAERRIQTLHT